MFFKIGVLKNFAIFTGKHLCWSLFLIKPHDSSPATLLKRDSYTGVPVNIAKFLRTSFFIEHLWWLLLTERLSVSLKLKTSYSNNFLQIVKISTGRYLIKHYLQSFLRIRVMLDFFQILGKPTSLKHFFIYWK